MIDKTHPIYNMSKEEVLHQLLKKEYGYYKAILEITHDEHEKLTSGLTTGSMQPLLKKKKILLSCIHEIEAAMLPLKKYWQTKVSRSDPVSIQIQEELISLNKLLKEILQLDLVNQKLLENHLANLKAKAAEKNKII